MSASPVVAEVGCVKDFERSFGVFMARWLSDHSGLVVTERCCEVRVAQGGVAPGPVVEHLDTARDCEPGAGSGEPVAVAHLVIHGCGERLGGGVVTAHTGFAHGPTYAEALAEAGELATVYGLGAAVEVGDRVGFEVPVSAGHPGGVNDRERAHVLGQPASSCHGCALVGRLAVPVVERRVRHLKHSAHSGTRLGGLFRPDPGSITTSIVRLSPACPPSVNTPMRGLLGQCW